MSDFQPRVTIVIPVYNGAAYLAQAIDSALAQTYPRLEVLVVDDGSQDESAAIAAGYGARLRLLRKPNGGVATALNLALEHMEGDYFSWLSHDDVYLPHKVAAQIETLAGLSDRETALYSDFEVIDRHSRKLREVRLDHRMLTEQPLYAVLRGAVHGCSTLLSRRSLQRFGGFDPNLRTTQDYALWFSMARATPWVHMPQILIQSRYHAAQGSYTDPRALPEANALWIGFAEALSEAEMLSCEPSIHRFYLCLARFLESTPYRQAQLRVEELARRESRAQLERRAQVLVSVVFTWPGAVTREALQQTHPHLEVRTLEDGRGPLQGEFVAFHDGQAHWDPDKLERQLQTMLETGAVFSYSDYRRLGRRRRCALGAPEYTDALDYLRIALPTVMVHRRILPSPLPPPGPALWLELAGRHPAEHWDRCPLEWSPPTDPESELTLTGQILAGHSGADLSRLLQRSLGLARRRDADRYREAVRTGRLSWPGAPISARLAGALARLGPLGDRLMVLLPRLAGLEERLRRRSKRAR